MKKFLPAEYQPSLNPLDHIVQDSNSLPGERIDLDVLFVGAGPASLSSAIHLANLTRAEGKELKIGIMEKADRLGGHTLSGAVINPCVFKQLFPNKKESEMPFRKKVTRESFYFLTKNFSLPLPVPPGMGNRGCYTASLCEVVRWLGAEAEQRGVHIFTSFPGDKLLMKQDRVVGVSSKAFGENKDGSREPSFEPANLIFAKTVVLSEGSRGHLTQSYLALKNIAGSYPQTYALGVKELWEVKKSPKGVLHTIAYPLSRDTFGGSWLYPMGDDLISVGLVAGLDSPAGDFSIHEKFQLMKKHPLFASWLKGGRCVEWGAKTIPEGGYHAVPEKLSGDGVLILGDGAGFVNMASLKGIHYAMASGLFAAETLFQAFQKGDFSVSVLGAYDTKIRNSFIQKDLYKFRNLRQSFHKGLFRGLFRAGLLTLTGGRFPRDFKPGELQVDGRIRRSLKDLEKKEPDKRELVYLSGNKTRDQIPSHLKTGKHIPREVGVFYQNMCPAGVYEQEGDRFAVSAPNCIDCKATDILGPRWSPRERGSGPDYKLM